MIKTLMTLFLLDPTIDWDNCRKKDNEKKENQRRKNDHNDDMTISRDLKNVIKRIICVENDTPLTREGYLDRLLKTAQDPAKLGLMWPGWAPHL